MKKKLVLWGIFCHGVLSMHVAQSMDQLTNRLNSLTDAFNKLTGHVQQMVVLEQYKLRTLDSYKDRVATLGEGAQKLYQQYVKADQQYQFTLNKNNERLKEAQRQFDDYSKRITDLSAQRVALLEQRKKASTEQQTYIDKQLKANSGQKDLLVYHRKNVQKHILDLNNETDKALTARAQIVQQFEAVYGGK